MRLTKWWMLITAFVIVGLLIGCDSPLAPEDDDDEDQVSNEDPNDEDEVSEDEYESVLEGLEIVGSMEVSTYAEFEAAIEDMNEVAEGFDPGDFEDEEEWATTVYQIRVVGDIGPDGFEANGQLRPGSGGMGSNFGIGIHVMGATEEPPTLDAGGESRILDFQWPNVAYVENLRFTGGSASGSHPHETGGAIRLNEYRWLEIHNSQFEENIGEWASIYARQLRIYDSYFANNTTIYLASQPDSEPGLIEGSVFEGHMSGAVKAEQPGDVIRDSVFIDNEDSSGGAVEFADGGRIEGSEFIENKADRWGGAVWSETEDQPLEIVDSTFRDNEAGGNPSFDDERPAAGAVQTDGRTGDDPGIVIEGSLFDSNDGYIHGDVYAEGAGHRITTKDTTYRPENEAFLEAPEGEVIDKGGNVFEPGAYTPEEWAEPFAMGDPVVVDHGGTRLVRMSDASGEGWDPHSIGSPNDAAYADGGNVLWLARSNAGLVAFDDYTADEPAPSVEVEDLEHAISVAVDDVGDRVYVYGSVEETGDLEDLEFAVWSVDFDGNLQQSTDEPLVDESAFESAESLGIDSIAGTTYYDGSLYVAFRAPSGSGNGDAISVKKIDPAAAPAEVRATYTLHEEIPEDALEGMSREVFGDLTARDGHIYVADGIGRRVLELDPELNDVTGEIGGFPGDPEDPQPGELYGPRRFVPVTTDDRLLVADQYESHHRDGDFIGFGHTRLVAFDALSESGWEAHGSWGSDLGEFQFFF